MSRSKPPPIPARALEVKREELETSFTPILRQLREATRELVSAAFVDVEGECIDYVSSIDPFEAKVAGAHMLVLVSQLCESHRKLGLQEPILMELSCGRRELWGRRISEEYLLVALLSPGFDAERLREDLAAAAAAFRDEVGITAPHWDPSGGVEVTLRQAVGWDYAPESFREDGTKVVIADVLGRWNEPATVAGEELVCFRVRTEDGVEMTLVHDPSGDGWAVRP